MVKVRMTRAGRRNLPYYRIAVFVTRTRRDGVYLELLGTYNPIAKDKTKKMLIDEARLKYWISKGAQLSDPMRLRLKKYGLLKK